MHTERSKKSSRISSDHQRPRPPTLNDLPQIAIDEILTRLPIKTAVGTSLISRSWRHRWKSIPDLSFYHLPAAFVSQALLLHTGPIHSFAFISFLSTPFVDCWLIALSSRAADSLHSLDIGFTRQTRKYHIHSAFFSLPNLTRFSFYSCRLTPPRDFSRFKYLQTLQLEKVSFPDASKLSSLISDSPFLRCVCLDDVKGRGRLKIRNPSLRCLDYRDVDFDDFVLGSAPLLYCADIRLCVKDCDQSYDDNDDVEGQWLGLGRRSLKILAMYGIPERIPISFDYLSRMSLGIDFRDMRSMSANICLLRSCPNLIELEIKSCFLNEHGTEDGGDIWDAQGNFDLFPNLKTVEMAGIMFEESELEFVRVILETAQVLESMVMHFDHASVRDKESAMMKLLEFRRASDQARIICTRKELF